MKIYIFLRKGISKMVHTLPLVNEWKYGEKLFQRASRVQKSENKVMFIAKKIKQLKIERYCKNKANQIASLIDTVDIDPIENSLFFYCIDVYKCLYHNKPILNNTTMDYNMVVREYLIIDSAQAIDEDRNTIIKSMQRYLERVKQNKEFYEKFTEQITAIESVFERPARTLFEALQRILFINQFIWQTGHNLVGLGRLDLILYDLYLQDLHSGILDKNKAFLMIKDFFKSLHEYYWFKSAALLGDTGQIIILGGREANGSYCCNDLTYLFIEVSKELKFPDPKVLLRCTADMPEDLLHLALECISTGIGAPLLSNDDVVIPSMISCGFDEIDAYNYCTAACWEPLVPGISCDANNCASLNFAEPLVEIFDMQEFERASSAEDIVTLYVSKLKEYIRNRLTLLTKLEFEEDPLLSLLSSSSLVRHKDITRGGAKYNNLGLTSVGLGVVVNSILNINKLVFQEKKYSIAELNDFRRNNFEGNEYLISELKGLLPAYGSDDSDVVELSKHIISAASEEFSKYRTKYGGCFKFGLSSPNYIDGAKAIQATLDGRKTGEPFSVHISSSKAIPTTELLSFAMKLDYSGNKVNGNVIDFFTTPSALKQNIEKFAMLLRAGFAGGIFQLQMNVVDSKTLIAAKADPKLFPDLVVRVWGFSAYFNDLPDEYKDVLIARAIESEKAA